MIRSNGAQSGDEFTVRLVADAVTETEEVTIDEISAQEAIGPNPTMDLFDLLRAFGSDETDPPPNGGSVWVLVLLCFGD